MKELSPFNAPWAFDENGKRLSPAEREKRNAQRPGLWQDHPEQPADVVLLTEEQRAEQNVAETLARQQLDAARLAAEPKPDPNMSPHGQMIADLERAHARALTSTDRAAIERRLSLYREAEEKFQAERAAARAREAFESSPPYINAIEAAEAYARTPAHESERVAAQAALITLQNACDAGLSVDDAVANFWGQIRVSESRAAIVLDDELQQKAAAAQAANDELQAMQARRDSLLPDADA